MSRHSGALLVLAMFLLAGGCSSDSAAGSGGKGGGAGIAGATGGGGGVAGAIAGGGGVAGATGGGGNAAGAGGTGGAAGAIAGTGGGAACATEGQACSFGRLCCGSLGLGCADFNTVTGSGVCRACKRVPATCAGNSDCCSGICDQGLCGGCMDLRSYCSTQLTCCPSTAYPSSCEFNPSVESNECCVVTGGNCRDDEDCCSRACRNGKC